MVDRSKPDGTIPSIRERLKMSHISIGVTPGISFPEYTLVGLMDGEPFVYYDSNIRQMVPKAEWIEENEGTDYWSRETQIQRDFQEIFRTSVAVLMRRYNQTTGVHTFQSVIGCELDDDGTKRGYLRHGYDGEDFISLDLNTITWTAANAKAIITKQKWEVTPLLANFWKRYLDITCIEWIKKYIGYGRATLERKAGTEISENTDSVTGHLSKCTDDIVRKINVTSFPNQKHWINAEDSGQTKSQSHCLQVCILLANVQSLDNKLDDLRARIKFQRDIRDCNLLCFTKWWLNPAVPNHTIQPAEFFSVHRVDRTADSGKSRGGGVYVMANMDTALCELHEALTQFQAQHRDAALIVVGEFNSANLKRAVPNLYQHVTFPTRGNRTPDHCYTPYKDSYKAQAHPPFGKSDHAAIFLLPKYKQRLKRETPVQREVARWTDQLVAAL
ncbi:hypothetical protein P4O66_000165 [Electrophorus voltai]|uniref:MHC class I-like antigen recognition-like domain-containing protein n=1 Tax=Electrophorus voltai TaxID=2609070 RepID=A0AAD8ZXV8_9TELE|nr:hypothetical protein P4O66_000165 [Electrophorus voltai]